MSAPAAAMLLAAAAADTKPFLIGSNTANAQSSTLVITTTVAVPAGSTIVVGSQSSSATANNDTITDSGSNTYTKTDGANIANGGTYPVALFYAKNVTALAVGATITLNISASNASYGAIVVAACLPNRDTTAPLDVHAVATATSNSGNITTGTAAEHLIGWESGYNATGPTITEDTNFTNLYSVTQIGGSNKVYGNLAYRIVTSTGTYNYNPTISAASEQASFIASFK